MPEFVSFSDTVRSFMDIFMQRSMRGWKHFARNSGLSMAQFSIIMQVHHGGPCSISDIGERFETSNAAASQLAEKLVQSGYLDRTEDPKDRRTRLLTLSQKGKDFVEESIRERYRWVDELASHLNLEEKEKVAEALELMTEAARKLQPAE